MYNPTVRAALALALALTFSCTSDIDLPPPPPEYSSSSTEVLGSSSSSPASTSWCLYNGDCFPVATETCSAIGGQIVESCPANTSSSSLPSSSSTQNTDSSSSMEEIYSSSAVETGGSVLCLYSGGCATVAAETCAILSGQQVQNCPAASNSSSGGVSPPPASSSSSSNVSPPPIVSSSSGSQGSGQVDGNVFTDQRDGKKYKFEVAPNGRAWMSENLNFSRNNTLGYCYGVDINGASPHRDSTSCGSGYGRFYEYATAMDGNGPQGLCPNGWHVPSTAEWNGIIGANKMSTGFYILSGNYNLNTQYPPVGWKEKGKNGFYWASNGNSYFTVFYEATGEKGAEAKSTASALDYFSIRCIANEDFRLSCGTGTYLPASQFCTNGEVYALCGNKEYKPATEFCSGTVISTLCGGKTYNPSTQECVGTTIHSKCGTMLYLPSTHFCSEGKIYDLCGGNAYNPAFEDCVSNTVKSKEGTCGGLTYFLSTHFCFGSTIYALCGGKSYNPESRECVGGNIKLKDGLYSITCTDGYRDANCGGEAKKTVTLKAGECVEINVLGYTNKDYLPTLGMRCQTQVPQENVSGSLTLNKGTSSKTTTIKGYWNWDGVIELGKIKVGDNEFGALCLTALSGATGVKCIGPSD